MHPLPAQLLSIFGATLATPWVAWQEARLLRKGSPLPEKLLTWARKQNIASPSKVRTLHAPVFPLPAPMFLRRWVDALGFPCLHLAGLSLRNGIYLAPDLADEEAVIQHELIHTRQYQEARSIFTFLRRYLFQCLTDGYHNCLMEREARGEPLKNRDSLM